MTAAEAYARQADERARRAEEAVVNERVRADVLRDRLEAA
jgi:hypothetical protein